MRYLITGLLFSTISSCTAPATSTSNNPDLPTQTGQEGTLPGQTEGEYYDPNASPLPLQSSWVLDRLNGMELAEAELRGEVPTLKIDLKTEKASGNAGCNRYNGSVKLGEGNTINFGHIISTKMACQSQPLENAFLGVLNFGLLTYSYTPNRLIIKRDVRAVLEFAPAR